jgi:hypothetical protein
VWVWPSRTPFTVDVPALAQQEATDPGAASPIQVARNTETVTAPTRKMKNPRASSFIPFTGQSSYRARWALSHCVSSWGVRRRPKDFNVQSKHDVKWNTALFASDRPPKNHMV